MCHESNHFHHEGLDAGGDSDFQSLHDSHGKNEDKEKHEHDNDMGESSAGRVEVFPIFLGSIKTNINFKFQAPICFKISRYHLPNFNGHQSSGMNMRFKMFESLHCEVGFLKCNRKLPFVPCFSKGLRVHSSAVSPLS